MNRREISVLFIEIKAIADKKTLWNHEAAIIDADGLGAAFGLVNEGADLDRTGPLVGEMAHQPLDGQAAVNNILHQQDIMALHGNGWRGAEDDIAGRGCAFSI